jgi:hypothetical protein
MAAPANKKRKVYDLVSDPVRDITVRTDPALVGLELYWPKVRESWVWTHIRVFSERNGDAKEWHWVCLLCKTKRTSGAFHATSNASRHLKGSDHSLKPPTSPAAMAPADAARKLFAAAYRTSSERALIEWIICDLRPVNITNTSAFKSLWKSLTADPLPVPATINTRISDSFVEARGALIRRLEPFATMCSLSTDGWSSQTMVPFTCVVAHFIDSKWELERRCIGVNEMSGGHTGTYIPSFHSSSLTSRPLPPSGPDAPSVGVGSVQTETSRVHE